MPSLLGAVDVDQGPQFPPLQLPYYLISNNVADVQRR